MSIQIQRNGFYLIMHDQGEFLCGWCLPTNTAIKMEEIPKGYTKTINSQIRAWKKAVKETGGIKKSHKIYKAWVKEGRPDIFHCLYGD